MATFNLTAAFDKSSYAVGETMTVTVSGTVTSDGSTPVSATLVVTAADGSSTNLNATSAVSGGSETFTLTSVTDTANRTWTISGLSATATA